MSDSAEIAGRAFLKLEGRTIIWPLWKLPDAKPDTSVGQLRMLRGGVREALEGTTERGLARRPLPDSAAGRATSPPESARVDPFSRRPVPLDRGVDGTDLMMPPYSDIRPVHVQHWATRSPTRSGCSPLGRRRSEVELALAGSSPTSRSSLRTSRSDLQTIPARRPSSRLLGEVSLRAQAPRRALDRWGLAERRPCRETLAQRLSFLRDQRVPPPYHPPTGRALFRCRGRRALRPAEKKPRVASTRCRRCSEAGAAAAMDSHDQDRREDSVDHREERPGAAEGPPYPARLARMRGPSEAEVLEELEHKPRATKTISRSTEAQYCVPRRRCTAASRRRSPGVGGCHSLSDIAARVRRPERRSSSVEERPERARRGARALSPAAHLSPAAPRVPRASTKS